MSRLLTVAFAATALLSGCASTPSHPSAPAAEAPGAAETSQAAAPAQTDSSLKLDAELLYGCRGDMTQARTLDANWNAAVLLENPPDYDACVTKVSTAPPPAPPAYADCTGDGMGSGRYQTKAFQERLARIERVQREYDEEVLPAHEEQLERLRALFPQGPFLCIKLTNHGQVTRRRVPVQHYSRPMSDFELCVDAGEAPYVRKSGNAGLRMDSVLIEAVAPGATVTRCVPLSQYEDMAHGAMLAPDEEAAAEFIHRYSDAWDIAELEGYSEAATKAVPSAPWPHVQATNLKYRPPCNRACY